MSHNEPTPEEYRQRYFALKAQAQKVHDARPATRQSDAPKIVAPELIAVEDVIPPGWYWTGRIARGQSLRLTNEQATAGIAALFWNAHDTSERFNPGDTVKVQWTARISRGHLLLSDMGRAMVSITEDTCGYSDLIANGTTRQALARKYGGDSYRRNTHDNFVLAAGKHGMTQKDVGPCISFFAPIVTDAAGKFSWADDAVKPGAYVDLRAEMDLIVALSNCPHFLSPRRDAAPVRFQIWNSPPAATDDRNRTASEEAVRAFQNTDSYLAEN
jgi:urea carboxylase-associated protein 2